MNNLFYNKDTIIHNRDSGYFDGSFLISNVKTKTHFRIHYKTLNLLSQYLDGNYDESFDDEWYLEDVTIFSQIYSLMADPTCINDDELDNFNNTNSSMYAVDKVSRETVVYGSRKSVIEALLKARILTDDSSSYKNYFKAKSNLFDTQSIGNFHQQAGFQLMMKYKIAPDKFWTSQKFKDDDVLDNLYRYIQLDFFKNYLDSMSLKDKKVLDVGCGTGYYSKLLLEKGAEVVGIDPNEDYIKIAKENTKNHRGGEFVKGTIEEGILDSDKYYNSFDLILISDMLLFYFVSPDPRFQNSPVELLKSIRRYLKEDGLLYITEPHGVFWLMPWLGSKEIPYAVVTEYANKVQKVTPTLQEASQAFKKAGYHIKEIFEPKPSVECEKNYSSRAYHFANEFPLWWVFILGREDR